MMSSGCPRYSAISSRSGSSIDSIRCVVRKPSWPTMAGVSDSSAVLRAIMLRSAASCAFLAEDLEEAGVVDAVVVVVAGVHVERRLGHGAAADVQHVGQALADRGIQRSRACRRCPGPDEKFAARRPVIDMPAVTAAAACSPSGSTKISGRPQMFRCPLGASSAQYSPICVEGVIG